MALLQPQSKYNEIAALLAKLQTHRRYTDRSTFEWRKLERDSKALRDAVPAEGWTMLAVTYSLVGDIEEANRCIQAALALPLEIEDAMNCITAYIALGMYSEAQGLFRRIALFQKGMLSKTMPLAAPTGSFHHFMTEVQRAKATGMSIADNSECEVLADAAKICHEAQLSDEEVARRLDAAGTVLRNNRLLPQVRLTAQNIPGVFSGVTISYEVDLTPAEAFLLNVELAEEEDRLAIEKVEAFDTLFVAMRK